RRAPAHRSRRPGVRHLGGRATSRACPGYWILIACGLVQFGGSLGDSYRRSVSCSANGRPITSELARTPTPPPPPGTPPPPYTTRVCPSWAGAAGCVLHPRVCPSRPAPARPERELKRILDLVADHSNSPNVMRTMEFRLRICQVNVRVEDMRKVKKYAIF